MKRHREVSLSSPTLDASEIARYVESFGQSTAGWECPLEKSRAYELACAQPSCCIVVKVLGLDHASICFSKSSPRIIRTTNIVPLALYELGVDQYNAIATEFTSAFRKQATKDGRDIRVSISKATATLSDVITGKVSSKLFQQYLAAHPRSGHPSDVERLDKFICSVSRYARKSFDLAAFEYLLIEEHGWSPDKARSCRTRVEIGLEVLATNRRY